jgi:hypothetical protein
MVPASLLLPLFFYNPLAALPSVSIPVAFYATAFDSDTPLSDYIKAAKTGRYISFEVVGCKRYQLIQSLSSMKDVGVVVGAVKRGLRAALGQNPAEVPTEDSEGIDQVLPEAGTAPDKVGTRSNNSSSSGDGCTGVLPEGQSSTGSNNNHSSKSSSSSCSSSSTEAVNSGPPACSDDQVGFMLVDQGVLLSTVLRPEALSIIAADPLTASEQLHGEQEERSPKHFSSQEL